VLAAGAVHVWRADLDVDPQLGELLCAEERERAARLISDREQRRWSHARGVLRALLGLYLDVDPSILRFRIGAHGKPSLDPPEVAFNLSHSAGVALYAITPSAAVGIDVELAHRLTDELAIAARIFEPDVAARLEAVAPPERAHEFLRAWVAHEAEVKRLGLSIGGRLPAARLAAWHAHLDLDGGAGALAVDLQPSDLQCWLWPPVEPPQAGLLARGS
jgi:4'-phosphopantetheinyl transferase